ncbi:MAG: hypothetical protein JO157_03945 [Acetobacteraceae bacterium]|nr:hypothetical protein [Acetobacteraceae bacterium]
MGRQVGEESRGLRLSTEAFVSVEHVAYVALGVLLALTALIALGAAAAALWDGIREVSADGIFITIDRLLLVLMLVEILHTVRVSMRSGGLTCEPFLIVGLIASIRRVLVITLESSQATQSGQSWSSEREAVFRASMIELGVLAVLILVMVVSLYLLQRSGSPSSDDAPSKG